MGTERRVTIKGTEVFGDTGCVLELNSGDGYISLYNENQRCTLKLTFLLCRVSVFYCF